MRVKCLNIGESHTGKTRAIGTLPGKGYIIDANIDPEGYESLRVPFEIIKAGQLAATLAKAPSTRVLVVDYASIPKKVRPDQNPQPSKEVVSKLITDINSIEPYFEKIDGIALDSLTLFGEHVIDFVVAFQGRLIPEIQDWRLAVMKVREILTMLLGVPKHIVLTAHIQSETDQGTNVRRQVPQVFGKDLPNDIPKLFSECFQSVTIPGKDGPTYKWLTRPQGMIGFLGSRKIDNLPVYIDPDYTRLFDYVKTDI